MGEGAGEMERESQPRFLELIIEVQGSQDYGQPQILWKYPPDYSDQEVLNAVPKFCFPFDTSRSALPGSTFTFALTGDAGQHRYGYCQATSPTTVLCLLSELPWFEVFHRLLQELLLILGDYQGVAFQKEMLLPQLYDIEVPEFGTLVEVGELGYFIAPDPAQLPSIPENRNLAQLCLSVPPASLSRLFGSMVGEHRLLLSSHDLSALTACVHALPLLLSPLSWHHVFIPALPAHLLEFCGAPMPFIIGVHSSLMKGVKKATGLEGVLVYHIDENTFEGDGVDNSIIPSHIESMLRTRLRRACDEEGEAVSRVFLQVQVSLFGSYRDGLVFNPGEPITFNEEAFLLRPPHALRPFLGEATQLQLFKQFVEDRLSRLNAGCGFTDEFERELEQQGAAVSVPYNQWLSTVKKGGGALLDTMRTRANPAVRHVYRFARQGLRGVTSRLKTPSRIESGHGGFTTLSPLHSPPAECASSYVKDRRRSSLPSPDACLPSTTEVPCVKNITSDHNCWAIMSMARSLNDLRLEDVEHKVVSVDQRHDSKPRPLLPDLASDFVNRNSPSLMALPRPQPRHYIHSSESSDQPLLKMPPTSSLPLVTSNSPATPESHHDLICLLDPLFSVTSESQTTSSRSIPALSPQLFPINVPFIPTPPMGQPYQPFPFLAHSPQPSSLGVPSMSHSPFISYPLTPSLSPQFCPRSFTPSHSPQASIRTQNPMHCKLPQTAPTGMLNQKMPPSPAVHSDNVSAEVVAERRRQWEIFD
uniref:DENN domain-containing protein 1B-like isoform X8 n=1 Tax=Myxine glutinosa TaxID=7769 RepID=UPI00358E7D41